MAYYSQEQLLRVKEIDLLTYLKNYEPNELVKISRDNYCTKTHDSLKISNGMWYWFSRCIGGKNALNYLIIVKDYTFTQAVEHLLNCLKYQQPIYYFTEKKKEIDNLEMPKRNENNDKVISYLTKRGIDKDIILECIDKDIIYQEKYTMNVVFVGYDKKKKPRYVNKRSTSDRRFFQEVEGSIKEFSFQLDSIEMCDRVHIFECAIDLLSYATLLKKDGKEWYNENYLSLAGIYKTQKNGESKTPIALTYFLNQHPNIKEIVIHFDNDETGIIASQAIRNNLSNRFIIIDEPPHCGKDFNDFLMIKINQKNRNIVLER